MAFREKRKRWLYALPMLALMALLAIVMMGGNGGLASAAAPTQQTTVSADAASKIEATVLQDTANGKKTEFMVVMASQADVSAANSMKDQDARGWYVYNTLKSHAERTQAGIRTMLGASSASSAPTKSFWALNAVLVSGDRNLVNTIAARADVSRIVSNRPTRWIENPKIANESPANTTPNTTEWGVNNVNAPQVWAMGYTGQGIVIANQDTGMRWTHNAIKPKYRGWNGATADHNYNWWDSIHSGGGSCTPNHQEPCDDHGHGTHTTGTTVGDDGTGNQVGVAPGAKWIGCRNMDQGNGTPATYTECFQFFIAPTDLTGNNPNPALRPHVMNNSWGCPVSEGCTTRGELETIINNTSAAGIFVEASAGNSGPGCSSVNDPPSLYSASFATGAIDISNNLASFSSRGPSTYYSPNILKPQVSAPGVNVRSSTRTSDSSYVNFSGTSMAGPHVVGVVALLWSARPQLVRDIETTKTILQNSANPNVVVSPQTCGGIPSSQIPNNSFGYGRVDALAAVNSVQQGTPTVVPPTATSTSIPPTATSTATSTSIPPTATSTATSTSIPPTATSTSVPNTPVPPTATMTACTIQFSDVPSGHTFYTSIRCLACQGMVSGYSDGTFRPNNQVTRGQLAKIVSNAARFSEPPGLAQRYEDVKADNTFYDYIERLSSRGYMSGYPCGRTPTEPCVEPENRPYFGPFANATRGQTSKIVANAAQIETPIPPDQQTFQDVPPSHTFWLWIERLATRNVMQGYACGGPGEPCVGPENRPYFRPGNDVTRGQSAKIVSNTFFQSCEPAARR